MALKPKKKDPYYEACDRAIQAMNRENLEAFGRLKMAKWDEIHVIKEVVALYREMYRRARKRYYEVACEAYVIGLLMCEIDVRKAHQMADEAITMKWVDGVLTQTDFVTLYKFDSEVERKAYRLAEALEVAEDRDLEINRALRLWSQQLGQFAINFTDYAVIQAFQDAGIEMVEWVTAQDEKVCHECYALDGQVFRIEEIPPKPHYGCRCQLRPVFRQDGD